MAWRMTSERWKELLEAGPSFVRGDPERILSKVYTPSVMWLAVRAALRRMAA